MDVSEYISAAKFSGIVGCPKTAVVTVAEAAGVRVWQVPGLAPRYHRVDVEAIAAGSLGVAGKMKPRQEARHAETGAAAQGGGR